MQSTTVLNQGKNKQLIPTVTCQCAKTINATIYINKEKNHTIELKYDQSHLKAHGIKMRKPLLQVSQYATSHVTTEVTASKYDGHSG